MTKMDEAWEKFDKAVSFEAMAYAPGKDGQPKTENLQRVALKRVDKLLDEAIVLEAEYVAEEAQAA